MLYKHNLFVFQQHSFSSYFHKQTTLLRLDLILTTVYFLIILHGSITQLSNRKAKSRYIVTRTQRESAKLGLRLRLRVTCTLYLRAHKLLYLARLAQHDRVCACVSVYGYVCQACLYSCHTPLLTDPRPMKA